MNTPVELNALPVWNAEGPLRCVERRMETEDTATLIFAPEAAQRFDYRPGQFALLGVDIAGKKHQRAYSISSTPSRPLLLAFTVKRVERGLVSNWLLDCVQEGAYVDVGKPLGEFHLDAATMPPHTLLISAGSGITPTMSMARWLLDTAQNTQIHFIHCTRDEDSVIFCDELNALAQKHANFHLHLLLSRSLSPGSGRLTLDKLAALVPDLQDAKAFLCGQDEFMKQVVDWLQTLGLAAGNIQMESFTPAAQSVIEADAQQYSLSVPDYGKETSIAAGQSLLEVMEVEGLPIIGACRSGICGSCKCKVNSGQVKSSSQETLTAEEIAQGYVLACSSTAESDVSIALG